MKHIEDGGTVAQLINDDGSTVFVCQTCKKVWIRDVPDRTHLSALKTALRSSPPMAGLDTRDRDELLGKLDLWG
jgi:hypothetical protein